MGARLTPNPPPPHPNTSYPHRLHTLVPLTPSMLPFSFTAHPSKPLAAPPPPSPSLYPPWATLPPHLPPSRPLVTFNPHLHPRPSIFTLHPLIMDADRRLNGGHTKSARRRARSGSGGEIPNKLASICTRTDDKTSKTMKKSAGR